MMTKGIYRANKINVSISRICRWGPNSQKLKNQNLFDKSVSSSPRDLKLWEKVTIRIPNKSYFMC